VGEPGPAGDLDPVELGPVLFRVVKEPQGTEYTALAVLGRGGKTSGLLGSAVLQIGLGHTQFAP
jgi:hypothetical protein